MLDFDFLLKYLVCELDYRIIDLEKVSILDPMNDLNENPESSNHNTLSDTLSYPLKEAREQFETNYLVNQLKKNNGNISKTADLIGMERSALHRKLKFLGIKGIN